MTSYETIFQRFESKIEDLAPEEIGVQGWHEMEKEYLNTALGMIELDDLYFYNDNDTKNTFSDRDDEIEEFGRDLSNKEIEILSLYMVVAWYEPKVNSLEHTLMYYGSKDEKWTSQKDHLKVISDKQQEYLRRARSYYSHNAGRNNPYLNGVL